MSFTVRIKTIAIKALSELPAHERLRSWLRSTGSPRRPTPAES